MDNIVFDNLALLNEVIGESGIGIHVSSSTNSISRRSNLWLTVPDSYSPDSAPIVPLIQTASDRAMFTAELEAEPVTKAPYSSNALPRPTPPPLYSSANPQMLYSNISPAISAVYLPQNSDVVSERQRDYTVNSPPPMLRSSSVSTQHIGLLSLFEDSPASHFETHWIYEPIRTAVELPTPDVEALPTSYSSTASQPFNSHHRGP